MSEAVRQYRARVARAREQRTRIRPVRVPPAVAAAIASGPHLRALLKHYHPSFSPFGDTPATQWANLVTLYNSATRKDADA